MNSDFHYHCDHKKHFVKGTVGIRGTICDPGNAKGAGLAVFRRNRLLSGSRRRAMARRLKIIRAERIGRWPRRLYGELHFDDDMEVTHTKDNLNWSAEDRRRLLEIN